MARILNITNGDSAVELMREGGVPGECLPWRDVLHEGPVPADLDLQALSSVRADFISSRGWGEADQVRLDFSRRDRILQSSVDYDRVVLWFEHDLYDQLQVLQLLDWFAGCEPGPGELAMICTDQYLGHLSPQQIRAHAGHEKPVTREQLILARQAWQAFREPDPSG